MTTKKTANDIMYTSEVTILREDCYDVKVGMSPFGEITISQGEVGEAEAIFLPDLAAANNLISALQILRDLG